MANEASSTSWCPFLCPIEKETSRPSTDYFPGIVLLKGEPSDKFSLLSPNFFRFSQKLGGFDAITYEPSNQQ